MAPPEFECLEELTEEEADAARAYAKDYSEMMHHLMQGGTGLDCASLDAKLASVQPLLPRVLSASGKFRLSTPAILYAGVRNGLPAVGSLWSSDSSRFAGMTYQYAGFFSASYRSEVAEAFVQKFPNSSPVLLTIEAQAGLKVVPFAALGHDTTHEGEFLVAPKTNFLIVDGERRMIGKYECLCLGLKWSAPA